MEQLETNVLPEHIKTLKSILLPILKDEVLNAKARYDELEVPESIGEVGSFYEEELQQLTHLLEHLEEDHNPEKALKIMLVLEETLKLNQHYLHDRLDKEQLVIRNKEMYNTRIWNFIDGYRVYLRQLVIVREMIAYIDGDKPYGIVLPVREPDDRGWKKVLQNLYAYIGMKEHFELCNANTEIDSEQQTLRRLHIDLWKEIERVGTTQRVRHAFAVAYLKYLDDYRSELQMSRDRMVNEHMYKHLAYVDALMYVIE